MNGTPQRAGVARNAGWVIEQPRQAAQQAHQVGEVGFAKRTRPLRLRRLYLFTGDAVNPPAQLGPANQGRTPIARVRRPLDVAMLLEPVDRLAHRLLADPAARGEVGDAVALWRQPLKDSVVVGPVVREVVRQGGRHASTEDLGWDDEEGTDEVAIDGVVGSNFGHGY